MARTKCESANLSRELLLEEAFQSFTVLGELLNTLVELIECHLVLEEGPSELGLVVDVADLGDRVGLSG